MEASLVGFALTSFLTPETFADWGWRLAFLIGATVIPLGLALRRSLPETLSAPDTLTLPHPRSMSQRKVAFLGFVILASATVGNYVQIDLTTYAADTLKFSSHVAFAAAIVNSLCVTCFDPVGGWLSDRFGREPVMIAATALFVIAAVPAFVAVDHLRTAATLYAACAVLGVLSGVSQPPAITAITEALPQKGTRWHSSDCLLARHFGVRRLDAVRDHLADRRNRKSTRARMVYVRGRNHRLGSHDCNA